MAMLENQTTKETVLLRAHHDIGRRRAINGTVLTDKVVSQVHASIRWEGAQWKIIDHSRNGTWLNGNRLKPGQLTDLQERDNLQFGSPEQPLWSLVNCAPPQSMLIPVTKGLPTIKLKRFHVLPDEQNPEISLYVDNNGQWICESESSVVTLADGDIVYHGANLWRFFCAEPVDDTIDYETALSFGLDSIHFNFQVSLDEEHTFLKVSWKKKVIDLGERAHHYLLLILARQHLADQTSGIAPNEQGWLDMTELSEMLDLDISHINIQIFRARQQIIKAFPDVMYLPQIVERRVGSVRFGYPYFQIVQGEKIAGHKRL